MLKEKHGNMEITTIAIAGVWPPQIENEFDIQNIAPGGMPYRPSQMTIKFDGVAWLAS